MASPAGTARGGGHAPRRGPTTFRLEIPVCPAGAAGPMRGLVCLEPYRSEVTRTKQVLLARVAVALTTTRRFVRLGLTLPRKARLPQELAQFVSRRLFVPRTLLPRPAWGKDVAKAIPTGDEIISLALLERADAM